jgi:hypothetical protein
MFKNK